MGGEADAQRATFVVHGRVQGVGFRWWCARRAAEVGVAGAVRNLPDGTVEVVVEGHPQQVEAMADWVRHGPPGAHVTGVEVARGELEGLTGFRTESHR